MNNMKKVSALIIMLMHAAHTAPKQSQLSKNFQKFNEICANQLSREYRLDVLRSYDEYHKNYLKRSTPCRPALDEHCVLKIFLIANLRYINKDLIKDLISQCPLKLVYQLIKDVPDLAKRRECETWFTAVCTERVRAKLGATYDEYDASRAEFVSVELFLDDSSLTLVYLISLGLDPNFKSDKFMIENEEDGYPISTDPRDSAILYCLGMSDSPNMRPSGDDLKKVSEFLEYNLGYMTEKEFGNIEALGNKVKLLCYVRFSILCKACNLAMWASFPVLRFKLERTDDNCMRIIFTDNGEFWMYIGEGDTNKRDALQNQNPICIQSSLPNQRPMQPLPDQTPTQPLSDNTSIQRQGITFKSLLWPLLGFILIIFVIYIVYHYSLLCRF